MAERDIRQIAVSESTDPGEFYSRTIVALCSDNTLWVLDDSANPRTPWRQLPPVPGTKM